ncbi:TIM21-domain-containing protein [Podospora appendiculata]|uniref:Mitochondrial import inner membrane translocase subunit Tim21 n=1 Tax=Podospora appendiculata TaxID=314037 RepID=A0AAE1CBC9_9PEZI|nr:TIM21-domain-containing protein [Podospora appendiculata]
MMKLVTPAGLRAASSSTTVTTTTTTAAAAAFFPAIRRCYATQNTSTGSGSGSAPEAARRKAVTPFNDDGHVPWTKLSLPEKTARAAQQSFNFGLVVLGVVMTGGVSYFLYQEVFSPSSKTAYFNRAVDRIKADRRCLELLGDSSKITAFGEETGNKWRRARPIASTDTKDAYGNEHLMIHFNVQGPKARGAVDMHLVKRAGHSEFEYKYFYLDVRGHPRIYLENASTSSSSSSSRGGDQKPVKLFGIKWT